MRTKKNIYHRPEINKLDTSVIPKSEYAHHVKFDKFGKIIESVFIKIDERGKPEV